MEKTIKVTEFWQAEDYNRNYDRNPYAEYNCECCGRKLNPKTMKQVQMLECGFWTDEQAEVKKVLDDFGTSQGFFYIGPKCYKEIRARLAASTETRKVEI